MEAVMSKTQSTATQLSESQLVILAAAAQRDDGSLLPIPQGLTAKGAALTKVMETLCKRKLIEERRTINGAPEWRRDEERHPLGLFITTSGLLALGFNNPEKEKPAQAAASMSRQRKTAAAKPPAKLGGRLPPILRAERRRRKANRIGSSGCCGGNPGSPSKTSSPRPVGSRIQCEASLAAS
jgi:hypothetical protein